MSNSFNDIQNKDDVIFRNVVVGVINSLNNKIKWNNTISGEHTEVVVPTFFTFGGSERFLADHFLKPISETNKTQSVYEKYPRMILNLGSISIQEDYLTNKHKRAMHTEMVDGELKQYNSVVYEMPYRMEFDITLIVDSIIDMYKAMDSIFNTLYKNVLFHVDYKGQRMPCHYSIPSDVSKERTIEYGVSDSKSIQVTFSIELSTIVPIFNEETTFFAGNNMDTIGAYYNIEKDPNEPIGKNNLPQGDGLNNPDGVVGRVTDTPKGIWPSETNDTTLPPDETTQ